MIKDLSTERARLHRFQPRYIRKDRDITRYVHANINYTDIDGRSKGRVIKWVRAGQSSHVRTDESETVVGAEENRLLLLVLSRAQSSG